ncbi:MAG TPA: YceI family protein [Candidatus Sulfotelmatobacter sp.]|nr:YceI family protein [Candidatus Sulfotelmatobacter sp.]
MKPIFLLAVIVLMVGAPAAAQSTQWQLDPAHSSAQFAVRHMGISTVRGTFTKLSGTARYDPADSKNDSVDVTIEATSVDSRVEMRDNDLRSDHFFDVQKYPTIAFRSTKVESAGTDKLKITGDLTIRGITKPVTLDVDGPSKPIKDGQGRFHMGVSATATVNRTDFGMTGYQGVVGNEVTLTIDAELVQTTANAK